MNPNHNPFTSIDVRLSNIEILLLDIKHGEKSKMIAPLNDKIHYIPITDIFDQKLISKPTFYKHLRAGLITMYKLGGRSYVDKREFEKAFEKVSISQ